MTFTGGGRECVCSIHKIDTSQNCNSSNSNRQLIFVYKGNVKHFHVHLINYGNKRLFVFSDSSPQ